MKRKTVIGLCLVLIAAVTAVVVFWQRSPEYGSGYSEEQRRLWNERRALFPVAWRCRCLTPEDEDIRYYLKHIVPYDLVQIKQEVKQRKKMDGMLREEQIRRRDMENLFWKLEPEQAPDTSSLAASEITVRECLKRARGGDGRACLEMALHMGLERYYGVLSWRQERDVEYWLSQAEAHGRPEARFLKNFLTISLKGIRKGIKLYSTSLSLTYIPCPDYTGLPGYGEFLKCVKSGDILPYRMMKRMARYHILPDREERILRDVLRNRVKTGDLRAMEDRARLFFYGFEKECENNIIRELKEIFWGRMAGMCPETMREGCIRLLLRWKLLDVEDTETMRDFREASECARMAARRGSLAGMDCWVRYGLFSLDYFTREDWEDVFRYRQILLERGYAPYIRCRQLLFDCSPNVDEEILKCCYPGKVLNDQNYLSSRLLLQRGETYICDPGIELPDGKDSGEVKRQLEDMLGIWGGDYVLSMILDKVGSWKPEDEVLAVYAGKVKSMASEGDPYGLFVLGHLYEHGYLLKRDLGEAWKYYMEALNRVSPVNTGYVYEHDPFNRENIVSNRLQYAIRLRILKMLVLYPDFPGRDAGRTMDMIYDLSDCLSPHYSRDEDGYTYYLFGRVYEDGIGTPVDRKKAVEYYAKSRTSHSGCAERWARLQNK